MEIKLSAISEKVKLMYVKTDKFLTSKIDIIFYLPISEDTITEYSLLPFYLTRTTKKYNTPKKFSEKLAELYGAGISTQVLKRGDNLVLSVSLYALKNSLALSGEDIFNELAEMMQEIIFNPNADDDKFIKEYVDGEKRLAIERVESEINDKRKYAVKKAISTICKGEHFGISKYGSVEEIEKVNEKSLFDSYKKFLKDAKIDCVVTGANPLSKDSNLYKSLENLGKCATKLNDTVFKSAKENPVEFSESMDVVQGKLVLGFRGKDEISIEDSAKYRVMADVFGGGPYSLLFLNVREKESLCYYCATSYERSKQLLLVDSGVEFENIEKTKSEILKYFDIVKKGEFPKETLEASKKSLTEIYRALGDSPDTLSTWYSSQILDGTSVSPEEYTKLISEVSYDDVVDVANKFDLDTVFSIKGL